MDPRSGSDLVGSTMHFILFEGLMRLNADGSLTPAQAKSVAISDDRLTYTFYLRGTQWSDGSSVTAKDFEKAWKKILSPEFPAANAHLLYVIKNGEAAKRGTLSLDDVGIQAVDDKTLVVQLEHPTPYFLDLVSFCLFFPVKHTLDEKEPTWMREASPHFISNGPFKLASWRHNNEIVFEKNPNYWEAPQINLDNIHISMVSDENTAFNMYENGELDLIGLGISPLPSDIVLQFQQKGLLKTQSSPASTIVNFNVSKFPLHNKNIRKALGYAIHRKEIIENITQLGEEVATNLIPSVLRGQESPSYFKDGDLQKARSFFQKGLKELHMSVEEFPHLTYLYARGELNRKLAQVLQQQWLSAFGVHVELQSIENRALVDRLQNHDFDLAQTYWIAQYHDPMSILERFKSSSQPKNYPGWQHPDYLRLLEEAAKAAAPEERLSKLAQAEKLFMDEMPLAPIYHWKTAFMIKDNLRYQEYPNNGFLELTRIQFKE